MERITRTYHVKLQEMCDCYMDTDYLTEMGQPIEVQSATLEGEALKYFALLILYTLTVKEQQLTVKKKKETLKVSVGASHEKKSIPPPPVEIADKIFEIIRAITHLDDDNGEMALALGLRSGRVDLQVRIKRKEDEESLKLLFPELGRE